jgi:hypothetical protein
MISELPPVAPPKVVTTTPWQKDCTIIAVTLILALISYAAAWRHAPFLSLDSPSYMSLARDLKAGTLTELSIRTPGFPLFLILTGSERTPRRVLFDMSLGLYFSAVGLLAWFLRSLGIRCRLIFCMMVIAILPPYVEPSAYADSENLCQFMVVVSTLSAALWRITQRRTFLWIYGIAALGAALTRPTYQFFVLAVAAAILLGNSLNLGKRERTLKLARALAGPVLLSILVLGGWATVNFMKFRYFDTSGMTAITLGHKTASFVECLPNEYTELRSTLLKYRDRELLIPFSDHTGQNYIHRALPELIRSAGNDKAKAFRVLKAADIYLITHKPASYLLESLKAGVTYWMPEDGELSNHNSGKWRVLWAVVQMAIVGGFLALAIIFVGFALVCLWVRGRVDWQLAVSQETADQITAYGICLMSVLYSAAISSFAGMGLPRFRETSDLMILACCFLGGVLFLKTADFLATCLGYRAKISSRGRPAASI